MTKVKLPQEVAEAIENVRKYGYRDSAIIATIENDIGCVVYGTMLPVLIEYARETDGGINILMRALVNGYEVEKAPEDKIRRYYDEAVKLSQEAKFPNGQSIAIERITAIRQTLGYLGIKIKGVNVIDDN